MTVTMSEVERALQPLAGKRLWRCTRAASMACFDLGASRKVKAFVGGAKDVGEFALHVQCPWRITHEDRIVVASEDVYYPAGHRSGDQLPAEFDWEHVSNLRDKRLSELFERNESLIVEQMQVGSAGAVSICLSGGFVMEIFPVDANVESWRLFEPGENKRHFVAGPGATSGLQ